MIIERLSRPAFFLALAFTLYMALAPSPPAMPTDGFGDKFQHMMAFGSLTFLARLGFPRMPDWLVLERLSFIGALIEVFQNIPSLHKDCDWHDWVADTIAIAVTLFIVARLRKLEWLGLAQPAASIS